MSNKLKQLFEDYDNDRLSPQDRQDFIDTWITFHKPQSYLFTILLNNIRSLSGMENLPPDAIKTITGDNVISLTNNFKKVEGVKTIMYWRENNDKVDIVSQFTKANGVLVIDGIADVDNDFTQDQLIEVVLNDQKTSIHSDDRFDDNQYIAWQHLVENGHRILIHDVESDNYIPISSVTELDSYCGHDGLRKFRFVVKNER